MASRLPRILFNPESRPDFALKSRIPSLKGNPASRKTYWRPSYRSRYARVPTILPHTRCGLIPRVSVPKVRRDAAECLASWEKRNTENIGFFTSHESIGTFTLDLARSSLSGDRDLQASRNKELGRRNIVCAVTTV